MKDLRQSQAAVGRHYHTQRLLEEFISWITLLMKVYLLFNQASMQRRTRYVIIEVGPGFHVPPIDPYRPSYLKPKLRVYTIHVIDTV